MDLKSEIDNIVTSSGITTMEGALTDVKAEIIGLIETPYQPTDEEILTAVRRGRNIYSSYIGQAKNVVAAIESAAFRSARLGDNRHE